MCVLSSFQTGDLLMDRVPTAAAATRWLLLSDRTDADEAVGALEHVDEVYKTVFERSAAANTIACNHQWQLRLVIALHTDLPPAASETLCHYVCYTQRGCGSA